MSALAQPASWPADPIEAFAARCATQAYLYACCNTTLPDAVDALQAAAIKLGLVESIGQDAVQARMADVFRPVREADEAIDVIPAALSAKDTGGDYYGLTGSFARLCRAADEEHARSANKPRSVRRRALRDVALSTLRTARYLIKQNDPKRLAVWLAQRGEPERAAIVAYIDQAKVTP